MPRHSFPAELPLTVHRKQPGSIPAQLAEQVRGHILQARLQPGDPLPSTRALAERLGISRGSVVSAYEQLSGEGYLETHPGGTRVAENLELQKIAGRRASAQNTVGQAPRNRSFRRETSPRMNATDPAAPRVRWDLTPGVPDTSLLTTASWRAAWRTAAAEPGLTYPAEGSFDLRIQLAEHLRLMRYVVCSPQDVLVTAGARDGFRLLLSTLRQHEHTRPLRIAVENPGYPSLHNIPAAFGHEIVPIALDEHGLDPQALPDPAPDVVLVAPSHQYPLGASMPVSRRLELLNWAEKNRAYIVEDDYDSELRYVGEPLPALAALARQRRIDRVVTLGSFTKTLAPGIGLGYLLAPEYLRKRMMDLRRVLGSPVSPLTQSAMTGFLADGGVRRHIARMRRFYRRRREVLLGELARLELPAQIEVLPMDGGLHVVLAFRGEWAVREHEQQVVESVRGTGVAVEALSSYWASAITTDIRHMQDERESAYGLVLGFGAVKERELAQAVAALGQTVAEHRLIP